MSLLQAFVLAVVQGATEFLPVSSSGHLVLVPALLGWEQAPLNFDIVLHFGTLVAVLAYYRRELWAICRHVVSPAKEKTSPEENSGPLGNANGRYVVVLIAIATIPAVVVGFSVQDWMDQVLLRPLPVGIGLLATGGALYLSERWSARGEGGDIGSMTRLDALLVGIAQAIAIMPGVSRSGSTISACLWRGLGREWAATFAFLMSVPPILGAFALAAKDMAADADIVAQLPCYLLGFAVSALVGYGAIYAVIRSVAQGRLFVRFGIYCLSVGLLSIVAGLLGWI